MQNSEGSNSEESECVPKLPVAVGRSVGRRDARLLGCSLSRLDRSVRIGCSVVFVRLVARAGEKSDMHL